MPGSFTNIKVSAVTDGSTDAAMMAGHGFGGTFGILIMKRNLITSSDEVYIHSEIS